MRSLFKAFCNLEEMKNVYCLSYLIYIVPLLSGQPLLSGHFSKSRGWPLNGGRTVFTIRLKKVNSIIQCLKQSYVNLLDNKEVQGLTAFSGSIQARKSVA